jgi:hypothetical protein
VKPEAFSRENGHFNPGTIPHMSDTNRPLTIRKLLQAHEDIAQLADRAQEITKLLVSAYGSEDRRAVRAQEIRDAIQRLQWAMERSKTMTA